ncbi:unnamed protein product [Moneuplotes crassus]|uniref:Uncharacterized protein n=1 Tax=Euplotes crassus TaxID=5936 RepID=A0AAD1U721_EUPCR|nr:unnamed protein product [Moneuplotes crassus]
MFIIEDQKRKMKSRGRKAQYETKTEPSGLDLPDISPSKESKKILDNFYPKSIKHYKSRLISESEYTSTPRLPPTSRQVRTVRQKKMLKEEEEVFTINTRHSKLERYTLKELCRQNRWKEVHNSITGSLIWFMSALRDIDLKILAYKKCYFNRYPRANLICRKSKFHSIMRKYTRFFPEEFDFIPDTFLLPDEFRAFSRKFSSSPDKVFIAKPSMSKGGEGIFFVKKKKDVSKDALKSVNFVVQEYIQNPLLLGNKFDLRVYLLIKGVDYLEAFVGLEGMARFCPKDNGSKRLLTSVWKELEKEGVDVDDIKKQIKDISTKIVLAFQPLLVNTYHTEIGLQGECNTNCFHIFGFDILIDSDYKCWLMEVNAHPSMCYVHEQVFKDEGGRPRTHKVPSDLDKYLKTLLLKEALDLVINNDVYGINNFKPKFSEDEPKGEKSSYVFEKVFPPEDVEKYAPFTIYNDIRVLFELLAGYKKPNNLTVSQFLKLSNYPGMKTDTFTKPDYTMLYQSYRRRSCKNEMTLDGFATALEHLALKLYPETLNTDESHDTDVSLLRLRTLVTDAITYASVSR